MERGKFITLEGIEGVGKTTVLTGLISICEDLLGKTVIRTREPGGTPLAERFRQILLENNDHDEVLNYKTELLLFFAGRAQHVARIIEPSLREGAFVVSDRFVDATYAYQGSGRELPFDEIDSLVKIVHPNIKPDITFLLDAPISVCLERLKNRNSKDRFERQDREFFEKVRKGYLQRASEEPDRIIVIDSDRSKKDVLQSIQYEIRRIFKC